MITRIYLPKPAFLWILAMVFCVAIGGCVPPFAPDAKATREATPHQESVTPNAAVTPLASQNTGDDTMPAFAVTPLVPDPDPLAGETMIDKNRMSVIVKLDFTPLAMYQGGIPGLAATSGDLDVNSEASQAYLRYANQQIDLFEQALHAAIPDAQIVQRFVVTYGGVSVVLPAKHVKQLRALPGVQTVTRDEIAFPDGREAK